VDRDAPGENADVGLPEEDGSLCAFSGRLEAEPDGSLRRSPRDADVSPVGTVELEDRGAVDAVRPAQPEVERDAASDDLSLQQSQLPYNR